MQRQHHLRLIAFFAALAAVGIAAGLIRLAQLGPRPQPSDVAWLLSVTITSTVFAAFAGVFYHRLTVSRLRWRETENYLARIRTESAKYHALMEGAADMLLIVDGHSGLIQECNLLAREQLATLTADRSAQRPAGGVASALESSEQPSIDSILADDDLGSFRAAVRRATETPGESQSLSEIRLRARDGRLLIADARLAAIEFGHESVVQISLRDLTQHKEMERQLHIRERLSSLGLLTAGVAHEINNPLEGIGNYIALLERENISTEARKRYLALVRHGFMSIRDIVRDLLSFARPASGEGIANLTEVVDRAVKLVGYSEKFRGVHIELVGLETGLSVVGDAGRLEQVIFNLLLNAATAMNSAGAITIGARKIESLAAENAQVELTVADNGPGIPPDNLDHIFDPFFTSGEGTGLGLSVSYGIVRAHGGTLTAENRESGGACFTIRLPLPSRTSVRA